MMTVRHQNNGWQRLKRFLFCNRYSFQPAFQTQPQILLLNETFQIVQQIDVATLPADASKKRGFGEWVQTVSLLDAQRGYFAAVDALREGIHLIDVPNRRRRFLATPPQWTIQTLTRIPAAMVTTVAKQHGQRAKQGVGIH